jgi:hypothetical protein
MIDIERDPLATRLSQIQIATPTFRSEKATVKPTAQVFVQTTRQRRGSRARAMLAFALLVLGVAATYSTIGEEALRWVGLRASQVEPLTGTARFGNSRLTVAGGYADGTNTVLFIGFENIDCTPFLTDQFGSRYDVEGGVGIGVGPYPAIFDPLRGQAATQGAVITVHCPIAGREVTIRLSGTLSPHSTHSLELPAAQVVDGTTYQIVGLRWSGTYLEVHTRMSGKLIDQLIAEAAALLPHPGQPPSPGGVISSGVTFPGVFLIAGSGSAEIPVAVMNGRDVQSELDAHHALDEVRIFRADHAGSYRIVVNRDQPDAPPIASWTLEVR